VTTTKPTKTKDAAAAFLANRRIAVTGVSHAPRGHGSNAVYARLKQRGFQAFAVNPTVETVEGDPSYPDLRSIPGGVEAVVIATRPDRALATMQEVVELGIRQVWMHRAFGAGSVSAEATAYGREHGVTVIDGGCPLMFGPTADGGHKAMCRMLTWTGKVPRTVT
jgi:predicted CoA-binding protein